MNSLRRRSCCKATAHCKKSRDPPLSSPTNVTASDKLIYSYIIWHANRWWLITMLTVIKGHLNNLSLIIQRIRHSRQPHNCSRVLQPVHTNGQYGGPLFGINHFEYLHCIFTYLLCVLICYVYLRQEGYVIVVCLSVCLSVSNFAQKLLHGFAWNFQGRLATGHWTND